MRTFPPPHARPQGSSRSCLGSADFARQPPRPLWDKRQLLTAQLRGATITLSNLAKAKGKPMKGVMFVALAGKAFTSASLAQGSFPTNSFDSSSPIAELLIRNRSWTPSTISAFPLASAGLHRYSLPRSGHAFHANGSVRRRHHRTRARTRKSTDRECL